MTKCNVPCIYCVYMSTSAQVSQKPSVQCILSYVESQTTSCIIIRMIKNIYIKVCVMSSIFL